MLNLSVKNILKITMPIMLGTFIQNIVLITDSILVNKLGTIAFDAANNAGLLYVCFFMILNGMGEGTQIQIAKEYGQSKITEIKNTLSNSFVIQFILSLFIFTFLFFLSGPFLNEIVKSDAVKSQMVEFLNYRSFGIFFAGFQVSIIGFYLGVGKTKIIIYSTLLLAISNIILDFGLIYGLFGLPQMGLKGAALASTISEGITFLYLFLNLLYNKAFIDFNFKTLIRQIYTLKSKLLLKLSYPLMIKGFISLSTWFIFFSLIEQMGELELEVAHVIRNLFFITFIPIYGFGSATRTYVAYYFGKKDFISIKKAILKLTVLCISFYILIFHGAILYPEKMVSIITQNKLVIPAATQILMIIFWSMLTYAVVNVFYNSVSALGKTILSLWIEIIAIIFYLYGTYLVILKWHWSIVDIWYVEFLYFVVIGLLSITYLIYYNKKLKHD
jgi:putative MATE family efflux protein